MVAESHCFFLQEQRSGTKLMFEKNNVKSGQTKGESRCRGGKWGDIISNNIIFIYNQIYKPDCKIYLQIPQLGLQQLEHILSCTAVLVPLHGPSSQPSCWWFHHTPSCFLAHYELLQGGKKCLVKKCRYFHAGHAT